MTKAEERLALINEALKAYTLFKNDREELEQTCLRLMEEMHSPEARADMSRFLEIKREFNKVKNQLIKANEDENLAWENIPTQAKKEVQAVTPIGAVFTTREFQRYVKEGCFIDYDGDGVFHDGKTATDLSVWNFEIDWKNITKEFIAQYPFVIWYNR